MHPTAAQQRLWIEEVRYLHALWHDAAPRRSIPNPSTTAALAIASSGRPSFKKRSKKPNVKTPPPAADEKEWPLAPAPAPNLNPTGWGVFPPNPPAASRRRAPPSAAAKAHQSALQACEDFFAPENNGSSSSDEDEDDAVIDEETDDDDAAESEAFEFFLGLFERDEELRGYYEKNCENGEFSCLVCWGIGEKMGRRYPNCVGLVQHANAIAKTKRRWAHRALAKVVCQVLAWDMARLPSIVLDIAEPLGKTIRQNVALQQEGDASREKEEIKDLPNEDAKLGEKEQLSEEIGDGNP